MKKIFSWFFIIIFIIIIIFFHNKYLLHNPNIIFIILDAARADHFSCCGYQKNTTPSIDKISKNGALFLNHFAQGTDTTASLPSIFFSRYFTLSIIENDAWMWEIKQEEPKYILKQFDPQQIFLTDILSSHGYKTAVFSNHTFFTDKSYLVKHFDYHFRYSRFSNKKIDLNKDLKDNKFLSEIISLLQKNKGQKFFIYWHVMFPHEPYNPGLENKEFLDDMDEKDIHIVREKHMNRKNNYANTFNEKEIKCLKGLYDSNLRYADTLVGILYEKLKTIGLLNKTLIIITADHGENLGDHGLVSHGSPPWDSVIKIPLIISYPSLIPKGIKVKGLTESIDIVPTILDICNIKLPNGKSLDGTSLLKYLHYPKKCKEVAFAVTYIRTIKYKYIFGKNLLFDLQQDPAEENNISEKESGIKENLISKYKQTMDPYRKLYENSMRKKTPDYPFYFGLADFDIAPLESIDECYVDDTMEYAPFSPLTERPTNKPWLLNRHWNSKKIFRLPDTGLSPPLTLSTTLPNGTYQIYILVGSFKKITYPLDNFGLKYRFNPEVSFNYPSSISLFRAEGDNYFYYYLYLGENIIKDNKFSFQIDFQPPDKNLYAIQHIKFVPVKAIDNNNNLQQNSSMKDAEFKRKKDDLRSLGYL